MDTVPSGRDLAHMRPCLTLARAAGAKGEAPVGALVVLDGRVVGEAEERVETTLDIAGHAEILAIRRACRALGVRTLECATLYTTAEPCLMCSYAIRETGINRVVLGATIPDIGGATSAYPILTVRDIAAWGPPPTVVHGILRVECEALRSP